MMLVHRNTESRDVPRKPVFKYSSSSTVYLLSEVLVWPTGHLPGRCLATARWRRRNYMTSHFSTRQSFGCWWNADRLYRDIDMNIGIKGYDVKHASNSRAIKKHMLSSFTIAFKYATQYLRLDECSTLGRRCSRLPFCSSSPSQLLEKFANVI